MTVGFVIPSFLFGGAERVMSIICNEFVENGHQVSLYLTEDSEQIFYPLDKKVRIVDITVNKKHFVSRLPIYINRLRKDLKRQGTDVVVSFITRTNIISVCACKMAKIPVIVSERNNPYIVPANRLWRMVRNFIYKFADGAVFQTKYAQDYFNTKVISKSTVIKNPMPEAVNLKYDYNKKQKRIVSVCRLESQKNVSLLIKAFNKIYKDIPGYSLHIYGDGSQRNMLESLIKSMEVSSAVFLEGSTPQVIQKVAKAKIFALSSNFEGLSNAVMEAMCVGTACVVTDSPSYGNRELISRGYNGFIVPVNDVDAMAEQIKQLALNDSLTKKISDNARKLYDSTNTKTIVLAWEMYINKIIYKYHK